MSPKRKKLRFLDMKSGINTNNSNLNIVESSILYSRGKKSDAFYTEDSKLYITPREAKLLRDGVKLNRNIHNWDNLSSRVVKEFVRYQKPNSASILMKLLEKRYELMMESAAEASQSLMGHFSLIRLWNLSIVGSILFGMVTMTFVYRYLGQGAAAASSEKQVAVAQQQSMQGKVLGVSTEAQTPEIPFSKQVEEIQKASDKAALEREIRGMVKGYPIEKMAPYIAEQDRTVAAFIVAIARKESSWGNRRPVLDGNDCYNYWGYRGIREKMGTGGHTCFENPKDAVETVAKRIKTLVEEEKQNTPAKMVVWKCGSNCAVTGGQAAADKWITDVDMYFKKFGNG